MPCDLRVKETIRQRTLDEIEKKLAAKTAQVRRTPLGVRIVGIEDLAQKAGMKDSCVLAGLQRRNSWAFRQACAAAGVQGQNFVAAHKH